MQLTKRWERPVLLAAVIVWFVASMHGQERPKLAGIWTLNRDLSDRTPTQPDGGGTRRGDGPGRGGFGGGFGGRGGGMPRGGGAGGDMPNPEQMKNMRAVMEELLRPSARLTIVQPEDTVVTFVDAEGHSRTYATSGKKEQHQLSSGTVDVRTTWDGSSLRQEITTGNLKVVKTYSLDSERRQLTVVIRNDGGRGNMPPMRHVYDEAERR